MSNFAKLTKKELIEKLETLQVEYRNVKDEANKNRINLDAMKSAYEGVDKENAKLNDSNLQLNDALINAKQRVEGLIADINGMSKQLSEKETKLKSAGKMQRGLFGTLILVLIVWIVTLLNFAI